MILINRITNFAIENYQSDIINCLNHNISVSFIEKIIVFSNNPKIILPNNNRIQLILKNNYSDSDIIEYVKRVYKTNVFIFSNPFIKFNHTLLNVNLNGNQYSKIDSDCFLFTNQSKTVKSDVIDDIFNSSHINFNVSLERRHNWTEDIKSDRIIISKQSFREKSKSEIAQNTLITNGKAVYNPISKIDIVVVSVDYNDLLVISLKNNLEIIKNITVVTSSEDTVCQEICKKFGVRCVITDRMYDDDAPFNKGKAINDGIKSLVNPEWILLIDADICLPKDFYQALEEVEKDPKSLFTCERYFCKDYESYKLWKQDSKNFNGRKERSKWLGYFQLFNINSVNQEYVYPEEFGDASWSDIAFRNKFTKKTELNTRVAHLGDAYVNWKGRKTERFIPEEYIGQIFENKLNNEEPKNTNNKSSKNSVLKKSDRDKIIKSKLAIITTFFNPNDYINIKHNYQKFSNNIKNKSDLFTIELSYNGDFFIESENCVRINGSDDNVLWQKERLLNILIKKIPKEYTNIAWVDCDILFENENWIEECNQKLEEYKVVQLYDHANRLDEFGNVELVSKGIIKRIDEINSIDINLSKGIPGFAWAIRREVIEEIDFLDTQIIGGGDSLMCYSFLGQRNGFVSNQMNKEWFNHYANWFEKTNKIVDKSVYYVSGIITHLYHGKMTNRKYNERYKVLSEYGFNPSKHLIKDKNDLWEIKDKDLSNKLKIYFETRNEDDNILDINKYFDKIFVVSLDRKPEKFFKVKDKLDRLGIKFERFSAIDGLYLEFDTSNFKPGNGMIENQFALGCLMSHLEIIKISKSRGYKKILIFEDDILISKDIKLTIQNLKDIKSWKLLYFGSSQYNWDVEFFEDNFYKSKKSLGTFAYAIDHSIYDELIELFEKKYKSVDNILADVQENHQGECFTFYPNICIADVSESDIRGKRDNVSHSVKMRWDKGGNYI